MKMSDILRGLADKLDSIEGGSEVETKTTGLTPVGDVPEGDTDSNTFVPPLQAKLEILKKSEGIPNVYGDKESVDEIDVIKKNAGISIIQHEASDDEPLDM
jgi:hypothetical protein